MVSWKKPTQGQIDIAVSNLNGNLKQQFFAKLENPEWFAPLNDRGLLWYSTNISEYGHEYKEWVSFPYLLKVAQEIPEQVIELIQPILSDIENNNQNDLWLVQICVSLAIKMPNAQFVNIIALYAKFIENSSFLGWQNHDELKMIIERLKPLNRELALKICKDLLSISLKSDNDSISDRLEPHIKLSNGGYEYEQILKLTRETFSDDAFKLLVTYISIITKEMISDLPKKQIEQYYGVEFIRRSAIEKHSQDNYKQDDPVYILVSEIRDIALSILQNNDSKEIKKMFKLLEDSNNQTMTRVVLHLLRASNNYDKTLLEKYLVNEVFFEDSAYHYEYYHLIQDKFSELSLDAQNIIFKYIEDGPKGEYYKTDSENGWTKQRKRESWTLHKLTPIRQFLPKKIYEKYKNILFDQNGEEISYGEHPDMLHWVESKWGVSSPLDASQLAEKSIDEIVEYLNSWEPDGYGINAPEVMGLAEELKKDAITNPNKYLEPLIKFEKIKDPTYIHYLLSGFREVGKEIDIYWKNLIHFGKWVVSQNQVLETRSRYREGDKDWYGAKCCVAELLSRAFGQKENLSALKDTAIDDAFEALCDLVFTKDRYLDERTKEPAGSGFDNYLQSAINTLHGKAVEGLINYIVWLKNNDKSLETVKPILDSLLTSPPYMETLAIIAQMLPWLHYATPETIENKIDLLLPEDPKKRKLFDVVWTTYLDYSRIFDSMFPVLENKFKYVLKNKLYTGGDANSREEKRISQQLAIHYARGLFELDSELLELIFYIPENYKEQWEFINFIGFSMWDKNTGETKETIKKEVIERFVKFWEWLLKNIEGKEADYAEILSQFERWYQCAKFDNDWALTQLHNLVMQHGVVMEIFMIEAQLLKDLPRFPRKVFDIVSTLTFVKRDYPHPSRNNLIETVVRYIKENEFTDDLSLKLDKDKFINKYLENCEGWRVSVEIERLTKYLEN